MSFLFMSDMRNNGLRVCSKVFVAYRIANLLQLSSLAQFPSHILDELPQFFGEHGWFFGFLL